MKITGIHIIRIQRKTQVHSRYGHSLAPVKESHLPLLLTSTDEITPTPGGGGCTCIANCDSTTPISPGYRYTGAGTWCFETTDPGDYINNWNNNIVEINVFNIINQYISRSDYPDMIDGKYYIYQDGPYPWSHPEALNY